jgi:hypothetical protein
MTIPLTASVNLGDKRRKSLTRIVLNGMKRKNWMKGIASRGITIAATDTFVLLCVTNVTGTMGRQRRRPVKLSHSKCPLARL